MPSYRHAVLTRLRRRLGRLWERAVVVGTTGWVRDRHPLSRDPTWLESRRARARVALAARQGDAATLERLHRAYWSGDDAERWHDRNERRFEDWFLPNAKTFTDAIENAVAEGGLCRVVEIGAGGGQVLAHLSTLFPHIPTFVGVDLNPAQTRRNNERFGSDRVSFVCSDAVAYVEEHGQEGTLYVTQNGVLEYLSEASLDRLLLAARSQPPIGFALLEPVVDDMDLSRDLLSRPYGGEGSFSHNYPFRLAEHGFSIRHLRESSYKGYRLLEIVTAVYSRMMCVTVPWELLLV